MKVPGSPRLHVWLGLVLALVGVLVGGYAYTGDRAYAIAYVAVAFLGFALLVVGSLLTAWGQAHKPRMGGREAARQGAQKSVAADQAPTTGAAAASTRKRRGRKAASSGPPTYVLECTACRHVFTAQGKAPFSATCPSCGHVGQVERPPEPVEGVDGAGDRRRRQPVTLEEAARAAEAGALDVRVACNACGHAFATRGQPPFEATCPSCGHVGEVPPPQRV